MRRVELNRYDNSWYRPGGMAKRALWYGCNMLMFKTLFPVPPGLKVAVLRLFGAKVGSGVMIKPDVNIKYPWFLEIGDDCWIGEGVWIDNLATVSIGNNAVLSQGAYLLTGSHDYTRTAFDLKLGKIVLEEGVWIGARAAVCPGVVCKSHSVLAVGSVATTDLDPYTIYQGNPAKPKRERVVT